MPTERVRTLLLTREVPTDFAALYDQSLDFVFLEFERKQKVYEMSLRVEKSGEVLVHSRRPIGLDGLPSPVREAFLRGESRIDVPWFPEFMEPSNPRGR